MTLYTVANANTIFAADINQIVNEVNNMAGDTGAITISGSTTGTVTLYQTLQTTIKYVVVLISTNWNSTLKTITLPVAFTNSAMLRVSGNMAPIRLLASGVAQSLNVVSAISGTTGAETTVSTTTPPTGAGWRARCGTAFDTLELSATGAVGAAMLILEGS